MGVYLTEDLEYSTQCVKSAAKPRTVTRMVNRNFKIFDKKISCSYIQELIMDEIPERDVTYHLTCLLIYHGTTTHLYSCFIFF